MLPVSGAEQLKASLAADPTGGCARVGQSGTSKKSGFFAWRRGFSRATALSIGNQFQRPAILAARLSDSTMGDTLQRSAVIVRLELFLARYTCACIKCFSFFNNAAAALSSNPTADDGPTVDRSDEDRTHLAARSRL